MPKILAALVLAGTGASLGACERSATEPVSLEPNSGVLRILEGDGQSDTILATLETEIRVELRLKGEEGAEPGPPIGGAIIRFEVETAECGAALDPGSTTGSSGRAATGWTLGTRATECEMAIGASTRGGIPLASARATAAALPGRGVEAWLPPGGVEEGPDSLVFSLANHAIFDAWENSLPWRLSVAEGPATVRGDSLDEPGSRTVVATGVGSGTVDLVTPHGTFLTLDLEVCERTEGLWIQLYRPGEGSPPVCA